MAHRSLRFTDFHADFDTLVRQGGQSASASPGTSRREDPAPHPAKPTRASRRRILCFAAYRWWRTHHGAFDQEGLTADPAHPGRVSPRVVYVLWSLWSETLQPLIYHPPLELVLTLCRNLPQPPPKR